MLQVITLSSSILVLSAGQSVYVSGVLNLITNYVNFQHLGLALFWHWGRAAFTTLRPIRIRAWTFYISRFSRKDTEVSHDLRSIAESTIKGRCLGSFARSPCPAIQARAKKVSARLLAREPQLSSVKRWSVSQNQIDPKLTQCLAGMTMAWSALASLYRPRLCERAREKYPMLLTSIQILRFATNQFLISDQRHARLRQNCNV